MSEGDVKQTNPLQIILIISLLLLAIVGLGWFALDSGGDADFPPPVGEPGVAESPAAGDDATVADTDANLAAETSTLADTEADGVDAVPEGQSSTQAVEALEEPAGAADLAQVVEINLRKARLAAEADMLTAPEGQSALHFYSLVLDADPQNALAEAELDAVLGVLAIRAADMLEAEQLGEAFNLAQQVSALRPDHVLVNNVQQSLNQTSGDLVGTAMQLAENGDGDAALEAMAAAESLPGQNPEYLQAVRESIDELLLAREQAARAAAEEREVAAQAVANWMGRVRDAIAAGRLGDDGEDSALAILAEGDEDGEIGRQLRSEWLSALLAAAAASIDEGDLGAAESIVTRAEAATSDDDDVARIRESLEVAYVAVESSNVKSMSDLDVLSRPAAEYPRRAEERGQSGWVDVEFRVTAEGRTTDVAVIDSNGGTIFHQAVIDAVSQWVFEPYAYRDRIIEPLVRTRIVFEVD